MATTRKSLPTILTYLILYTLIPFGCFSAISHSNSKEEAKRESKIKEIIAQKEAKIEKERNFLETNGYTNFDDINWKNASQLQVAIDSIYKIKISEITIDEVFFNKEGKLVLSGNRSFGFMEPTLVKFYLISQTKASSEKTFNLTKDVSYDGAIFVRNPKSEYKFLQREPFLLVTGELVMVVSKDEYNQILDNQNN